MSGLNRKGPDNAGSKTGKMRGLCNKATQNSNSFDLFSGRRKENNRRCNAKDAGSGFHRGNRCRGRLVHSV